ncbi:hypothetical protein FRC18_003068, partial [Serendipita sp. 400]
MASACPSTTPLVSLASTSASSFMHLAKSSSTCFCPKRSTWYGAPITRWAASNPAFGWSVLSSWYIRPDRMCVIGLGPIASIPLLAYDVFLNVFLTGMFVYPLLRHKLSNPKLRGLAKHTCFAAAVALGTSVVNILILTLLHGRQLGWVCLASCGFDVTVNALVIYFITNTTTSHSTSSYNKKQLHGNPPTHVSVHAMSVHNTAGLPHSSAFDYMSHANGNGNGNGNGIGTTSILRNPQVFRFETTKETIAPSSSSMKG